MDSIELKPPRNDSWVRTSFMVPTGALSDLDRRNRFLSDARMEYADTTLGGNRCINPPPQFCRYADPKVAGLLSGQRSGDGDNVFVSASTGVNPTGSRGIGRQYHEMFGNTGEYVTFRMGVPKYNPILSFFNNMYDPEASAIARTGKGLNLFYETGRVVGFVVGAALAPALLTARVISFFIGTRVSKYYYLQYTMHNYWAAANNIANSLAVNLNIIPTVGGRGESKEEVAARQAEIKAYHACLPDIFRSDGGIDLYRVANRHSRLALQFREKVNAIAKDSSGISDFRNRLQTGLTGGLTDTNSRDIKQYINDYLAVQENKLKEQPEQEVQAFKMATAQSGGQTTEENKSLVSAVWDWGKDAMTNFLAEENDGGQFVTFRVDHTGPSGDSFSNSVGESNIKGKINSIVSQARSLRFDTGDFQTGVGMFDAVLSGVKSMAAGATDSIGLSGLQAFAGNAYVDIPRVWQESSAVLNRMTYTVELRSWSGAPMARFQNIWVPFSMLLAMVLPLSTGKQSYTSPFLLEAFSQGRAQTRLGIVESMDIQRGVGNLGRDFDGNPLGITVNFTIADLSTVLHMPISTGIGAWAGIAQAIGSGVDNIGNALNSATGGTGSSRAGQTIAAALDPNVYDDDTNLSDYMAVCAGMSTAEQVYQVTKWKLNLTRQMANYETWSSLSSAQNQFAGSTPGRILSILAKGANPGA